MSNIGNIKLFNNLTTTDVINKYLNDKHVTGIETLPNNQNVNYLVVKSIPGEQFNKNNVELGNKFRIQLAKVFYFDDIDAINTFLSTHCVINLESAKLKKCLVVVYYVEESKGI